MKQRIRPRSLALASIVGLVCAASAGAQDRSDPRSTWHVANNGTDSASCGRRDNPCRSIGRAIAQAKARDLILVGPGRYGDLDGDGQLGGAGEEAPNCSQTILCIEKTVTILSTRGAALTVIDGQSGFFTGVELIADDIVFGLPSAGFTVTRMSAGGIFVRGTRIWVGGNIAATNSGSGFFVLASGRDNRLIGNIASGHDANGFLDLGEGLELIGNTAHSNSLGFNLGGVRARMTGNVATANINGIRIITSGHTISRMSLIGNQRAGIDTFGGLTDVRVSESNIFGNGTWTQFPRNCGIITSAGNLIDARNNFWGAATGPGADPADAVCNGNPDEIPTVPFARRPFRIAAERLAAQAPAPAVEP